MKLKSKQTGEIMEFDAVLVVKDIKGNEVAHLEYNSIDKFLEEWEDATEEPKEFYWIDECGRIDSDVICEEFKEDIDTQKSIGNYFETKEEAEEAVKKLKAWKRLKDRGFRFGDWRSEEGAKLKFPLGEVYDVHYSRSDACKDLNLLFGGEE